MMRNPLRVLIVGRSGPALSRVGDLLADQRQVQVSVRALDEGQAFPLTDLQEPCDTIVLVVGADWRATLDACFERQAPAVKPLLVVGPAGDMDLLRRSMRVGARDFFSLPLGDSDLLSALDRLAREEHERRGSLSARVTTFINAKGGSGASFCAANFAHILAKGFNRRTVLLDFELQFGSLPTYFNLQSRNGLIHALELVDTLDATALQGFTQKHGSGLALLSSAAEGLVLPEDVHEERIAKLFAVLDDAFEELVIDLPRRIDRANAAVLDRSDLIMLVVQQTVAHLHEISRLAGLLSGALGIAADRMVVLVNRFAPRGEVTVKDFAEALRGLRIETLPNDYRRVSQSINLGVPLLDAEPHAPLCRSLLELVRSLTTPIPPPLHRRGPWAWLPRPSHLR